MKWNCPHCGAGLSINDEKVTLGWSFSRCYACGGFALIKKADINVIKIDRAPLSEPVLLAESEQKDVLNHHAAKELSRIRQGSTISPKQALAYQDQKKISSHSFYKSNLMAMAIGVTGFISVVSGLYLYIKGQALWSQAKVIIADDSEPTKIIESKSLKTTSKIE